MSRDVQDAYALNLAQQRRIRVNVTHLFHHETGLYLIYAKSIVVHVWDQCESLELCLVAQL